jgi:hypothetical protein
MAYLSKDDLKIYLKIASAVTTDDTLLTTLIARAQARIDAHCNQSFEATADSTRYFSSLSIEQGGAVDGRDLILDAPLCAITSVTNGDGVVASASDYTLLPINGTPKYAIRLKQASGLFWTYDDDVESDLIAVVGKWAYSASAPNDIVHACTLLAAWYYRRRQNADDLDRTVITAGQTILPSRMPKEVLDILEDGYVRTIFSGAG